MLTFGRANIGAQSGGSIGFFILGVILRGKKAQSIRSCQMRYNELSRSRENIARESPKSGNGHYMVTPGVGYCMGISSDGGGRGCQ